MLDNLIINIRTILPSAKTTTAVAAATASHSNRCQDDDKFHKNYGNNESAIAFLKYSSNCNDDAILNETTNRTMLHVVRSYFSHFYQKRRPASDVDSNNDAIMLPRVYNYPDLQCNWDPIELKVNEKCIEDIDNVIDKFVRVVRVNENNSPIRPAQFYVHIYSDLKERSVLSDFFPLNFLIKINQFCFLLSSFTETK